MNRRAAGRALLGALLGLSAAGPAWAADDTAWAALRAGGHVLIVRHAQTDPGIGDPPGFRLGECATQRNLSGAGRAQAESMGQALATRSIAVGPVLSSRWCRCLDTARLAFGRVEPWPPLDSFFGERSTEVARTTAVRARVGDWRGRDNLVLITHQVNITALTDEVPASGEALVLRPDGSGSFALVGRLQF
jgi:phosphohistidine phosphatase SixA